MAAHRQRDLAAVALDVTLGLCALHAVEDSRDHDGDSLEAVTGAKGGGLIVLVRRLSLHRAEATLRGCARFRD
jgi:hypothetical protein